MVDNFSLHQIYVYYVFMLVSHVHSLMNCIYLFFIIHVFVGFLIVKIIYSNCFDFDSLFSARQSRRDNRLIFNYQLIHCLIPFDSQVSSRAFVGKEVLCFDRLSSMAKANRSQEVYVSISQSGKLG